MRVTGARRTKNYYEHSRLFEETPMIAFSKICTACLAGALLLAVTFLLLPKGTHNGDAWAGPVNPATQTTAPDQW